MRSFKFFPLLCAMMFMAANNLFADAVLDNCELGSNQNTFGYYWYFYDDSADGGQSTCNNSTATVAKTSSGYTVSATAAAGYEGYGMVMPYTLGATGISPYFYSYAGCGTMLCAAGKTIDLSSATSISFWIKADKSTVLHFQVLDTVNVIDYAYYYASVTATTTWTKVTVNLGTGEGGLLQYAWTTSPVTFSAKTLSKIQWQVHSDQLDLGATGTIYLDDIVINGYTYVARDNGVGCLTTAGSGTGALLSNMDVTPYNQNARTFYWFAYNDALGRTTQTASEVSQITSGATVSDDFLTSTIDVTLAKGYSSSNGAALEFTLGTKYINSANTSVQPFVGVGTSLYNEKTSADLYNATADGATGIYFDYTLSSSDTNAKLRMEVYANEFSKEGVVHYLYFPNTGSGVWKGASVPFSKLVLPEWDGVNTSEALTTTALKKIQWAFQSASGTTGSFAVDNVYMLDASKITSPSGAVKYQSNTNKSFNGFTPSIANNSLKVTFNKGMSNGVISLVNTKGAVMARSSVKDLTAQVNVAGFAKGVYMLVVKSASFEKTVPVTIY